MEHPSEHYTSSLLMRWEEADLVIPTHPRWQDWVLGEKEGIEHIKYAYEAGINTFE